MSDTIKIDVESEDASKKLKNVADGVEEVNSKLDNNKSANDSAAKSTSGYADKAAKAVVVLAGLKAVLVDTIKAFAEQDALNGQLQRSLRKTTETQEAATKSFKKAQALFTDNAKFGIGIAEQTAAYRKLIDSSGDAEQSLNDLTLAVDIQAQADVDLAGATEILRKARQGDTGALKKLGVVTKDQEKLLASLTDETARAEIAVQILSEAYAGAAVENAGLADKLAETDVQIERVKVATGKLVGALWTGTNSLVDGVLEVSGTLPKGTTPLEAFAGGMEKVGNMTSDATTELALFIKEYKVADFMAMRGFSEVSDRAHDKEAKRLAKLKKERQKLKDEGKADPKNEFYFDEDGNEVGPDKTSAEMQKEALAKEKAAKQAIALEKKRAAAAAKAAAAREREAAAAERALSARIDEDARSAADDLIGGIDENIAEDEAQKKLDFELQLQQLKNDSFATNDERQKAEIENESELLRIKNASLDPALESLKIEAARLKLAKKIKSLDEAKRVKLETANLKKKADAEAAVGTAIDLSAQGFSVAAGLFGAGERTKAGISAAVQGAKATAAFASGNIPGGIGHGIAAAQFAAVAGGAGGSSGSASGGAASVAQPGASFGGSDSEELAIAGRTEESKASTLTIVNNYNSAFPPSPEQERELRASTERDARRRV